MRKLTHILGCAGLAIIFGAVLCFAQVPSLRFLFPGGVVASGGGPPPPTCGTAGTVCSLLGTFSNGTAVFSWLNRYYDFIGNNIAQNMCTLDDTYPIVPGSDTGPNGVASPTNFPTYQSEVSMVSGCPSRIYLFRVQNEWYQGCNPSNPWYPGCNEANTAGWSVANWKTDFCAMVNYIRNTFPGMKISYYAPITIAEQAYDPTGSCTIDLAEYHIYIFGDNIQGRTGAGDWAMMRYCGVAAPSVNCDPNSNLGRVAAWASSHSLPLYIGEWCSSYNDTASPDGTDMATYLIIKWMIANNVVGSMYWSQMASQISPCDPNQLLNVRAALIKGFYGTRYGGTFFNYKALPGPPNPYAMERKREYAFR